MICGEFGIAHHYWHEAASTVYCVPPKCGSSAMKYALLGAEQTHLNVLFNNDISRVHDYSHLVMVKRRSQITMAAHKVLITRNPFNRVMSAFVSKFVVHPEDVITQDICKLAEVDGDDMTFRTYIATIARMPDVYLDPHFRSQEDFLVLPVEHYTALSLDAGSSAYTDVLNAIQPGASERHSHLLTTHETNRHGPITDLDREVVPGRLADRTVKFLRYLRQNGSAIARTELAFDGFEAIIQNRYAYDFVLNTNHKSTKPAKPKAV